MVWIRDIQEGFDPKWGMRRTMVFGGSINVRIGIFGTKSKI